MPDWDVQISLTENEHSISDLVVDSVDRVRMKLTLTDHDIPEAMRLLIEQEATDLLKKRDPQAIERNAPFLLSQGDLDRLHDLEWRHLEGLVDIYLKHAFLNVVKNLPLSRSDTGRPDAELAILVDSPNGCRRFVFALDKELPDLGIRTMGSVIRPKHWRPGIDRAGSAECDKAYRSLTDLEYRINDKHWKDWDHLHAHYVNRRDVFLTWDKGILSFSAGLRDELNLVVMKPDEYLEMVVVAAPAQESPTATQTATPSDSSNVDALAMWDDNKNGRISCAEARSHSIAPSSSGPSGIRIHGRPRQRRHCL